MRLGTVIGRVTLSVRHSSLQGERLLVVLPWSTQTYRDGTGHDYSIVVYDEMGADVGQTIGISESTEASRPFSRPTPVDAYCAALIDEVFSPPAEPTR
jgi:carbon dioxide concentrating mechanism protein CcmL